MDAKGTVAPVYSQIALDIALRITRGEIKENTRLYGRSVLASQYGVSPETIRRAMRLLEDMEVVETREGRGSLVISKVKAQEYVDKFSEYNDIRAKQQRLKELLQEQEKLCRKISDAADSIVRINEHFTITLPFTIYEETIPDTSPLIDKTLKKPILAEDQGYDYRDTPRRPDYLSPALRRNVGRRHSYVYRRYKKRGGRHILH